MNHKTTEVFMKKLTIFMFIVTLLVGTVSAQAIRDQRQQPPAQPTDRPERATRPDRPEPGQRPSRNSEAQTTVEGTLKLQNGFIVIERGDTVYLVPMLNRYIGFIGGLREGNNVSVEGRVSRNVIHPAKVTIDGKDYSFFGPGQQLSSNRPDRQRGEVTPRTDQRRENFGPGHNNFAPNWRNIPDRRNAPGHFGPWQRNAPSRGGCCR
jgi:hypothetical protein